MNLITATDAQIKSLSPEYLSAYTVGGLKLAIKKGYDINKKNSRNFDILYYVAKKGFVTHVKYLIELGMNLNQKYNNKKLYDILIYKYNKSTSEYLKIKLKKVLRLFDSK